MINEQEVFEKNFSVRYGVITSVDNSTESRTTGSGGQSYQGFDGKQHVSAVNISTKVIKKSRVWIQFDGESAASTHLDFKNDEFICTGTQKIGAVFHKATGAMVLLFNKSTDQLFHFCDDSNLTHAVFLDEGYPLPAWGLDVKNGRGQVQVIGPKFKTKFVTDSIHINELMFHYAKPGASKFLKYWFKRSLIIVFIGIPISSIIAAMILGLGGEHPGDFKSILLIILALIAMLGSVFATYRLSGFALRNEAYPRFIKAGGKDRTEDWNAFVEKIEAFWAHGAKLLRA